MNSPPQKVPWVPILCVKFLVNYTLRCLNTECLRPNGFIVRLTVFCLVWKQKRLVLVELVGSYTAAKQLTQGKLPQGQWMRWRN